MDNSEVSPFLCFDTARPLPTLPSFVFLATARNAHTSHRHKFHTNPDIYLHSPGTHHHITRLDEIVFSRFCRKIVSLFESIQSSPEDVFEQEQLRRSRNRRVGDERGRFVHCLGSRLLPYFLIFFLHFGTNESKHTYKIF